MIKLDREVIDNQIKAAKALASAAVLEGCRTTIERECKYWENIEPKRWLGEIKDPVLTISDNSKIYALINIKDEDGILYDKMMCNKGTSISNTETMHCRYTIVQVLVDYDTELKITFDVESPLTEEDLWTLRNLGKVKTEHSHYSSVSESIVCEI